PVESAQRDNVRAQQWCMTDDERAASTNPVSDAADRDGQRQKRNRRPRVEQRQPLRTRVRSLDDEQVDERIADRDKAECGREDERAAKRRVGENRERLSPPSVCRRQARSPG